MTKPLDFAKALFVRRMTDCFIDVEWVNGHPFGNKGPGTVNLSEPIHEKSAERLIEATENLARRIAHISKRKRSKIRCSELQLLTSELKLTVFEFQETE